MEKTLGGDRLGGGKKMKVHMRNYERSTHDLSEAFRTSMSAGTLVPFLKKVALPGDTFDIDLNCQVMTLPTLGPLFGTYQVQMDIFLCPLRLYQAKLHMNMLGIGLKMEEVELPQIQVKGVTPTIANANMDNLHINPSSILKYLGISGLGKNTTNNFTTRKFNAVPILAYWDMYKNYYANKMEGVGMMIHKKNTPNGISLVSAIIYGATPSPATLDIADPYDGTELTLPENREGMYTVITLNDLTTGVPLENIMFGWYNETLDTRIPMPITAFFSDWQYDITGNRLIGTNFIWPWPPQRTLIISGAQYEENEEIKDGYPTIESFPLENIDNMRLEILQATAPVIITDISPGYAPYSNILESDEDEVTPANSKYAIQYTQEGLGLRTYKSDLFNNWLDTEFIDGEDGISEVTKVSTIGNSFTIDELNMSKKLWEMLNRIAVSGGSYDDWLDAVYTENRTRSAETPMYMGGMIQDLVFNEVISTAQTTEAPLGQLAGRGKTGDFQKGGKVVIKVDEPSYIMGIVSIVPNIDYTQGNDWDMNLKTMNDLHKPALDEIGFQDLITEQMAWWDTTVNDALVTTYHSAGKQPAWINYMTSVNKAYGTFADRNQQMFMVLARRYETMWPAVATGPSIADLTTYVDPSKFNHIFADTRLDAQNFWVQIGIGIEARRKMSAKVIPNL